jgi:hypothetical protein
MTESDIGYTTCATSTSNITLYELTEAIKKISMIPRVCAIGSKEIESGKIFIHSDKSPICIEGYDKTIYYNSNDIKIEEQLIKFGAEFLR